MMYHMIHGICEYAQRTSSLRMCNTLHENDACILHIYTYPHLFEAVWACMDNPIL